MEEEVHKPSTTFDFSGRADAATLAVLAMRLVLRAFGTEVKAGRSFRLKRQQQSCGENGPMAKELAYDVGDYIVYPSHG
jgi:hypothetical protein